MPFSVDGDHANRVVDFGSHPISSSVGVGFPLQPFFEAFGGEELLRFETHFEREAESPLARQRGVTRLFEHQSCHRNRILDVTEAANRAGVMARPVHNRGIKFDFSFFVREDRRSQRSLPSDHSPER